jgi:opacity protein-like surface antigen
MRIPFCLLLSAALATSVQAQDDSPFYLQLGFGGVASEDASGVPGGTVGFDPGFSASAAFGYEHPLSSRLSLDLELEAYYQAFKVDEDDFLAIPSAVEDDAKAFAFLVNGILDVHITSQYSLYGGFGVGYADVIDYSAWDSGNLQVNDDSGLAGQARFGFAYGLGGPRDVRIGYRYFKTEPVDVEDLVSGSVDEIDVAQHSVEVTFRWGVL